MTAAAAAGVTRAGRALLAGNFAIGCGVMVTAGALNDLAYSLQVSAAVAGQLITVAAVAMGTGAPLLAAVMGHWDRRRLLTLALLWYAVGHAISALMPSLATLLPVRALSVLAAAVFTPQAAAAISVLAPPEQRGRAITHIFLGWSLASVLGMPVHSYVAETLGWRWAFALVAVLSLAAAWGVWRAVPAGVRPPPLSLRNWGTALSNPLFMGMVAVTALSGAGQFTLFSYFAPYYRQTLGAGPAGVSFLFLWFGAFGLLGNLLLSRSIDRWGAARCVNFTLAMMALSRAAWPLAASVTAMSLVLVPWALGCFSSNSAQQARLSSSSGAYAPALLALNTSAIYIGQAVGAGGGGFLLAAGGFGALPWAALAWMVAAIALSVWVARRMRCLPR
ncbi:MAG TPA: MFS transporter [Rubrivivax sp.]|nr:MFS transporter [Rubrivivax sp.]